MEIERKWLIRREWKMLSEMHRPDIQPIRVSYAEILYLSVDPYIRVRKSHTIRASKLNSEYEFDHVIITQEKNPCVAGPQERPLDEPNAKLTYKGTGLLSREEIETPVQLGFYDEMKEHLGINPIIKEHHVYHLNGYHEPLVIMDVDRNTPTAFSYAEMEFDTEEQAHAFVFPWPDIVEKEVTEDPYYKMNRYWERTRLGRDITASTINRAANGCEAICMDTD